MQTLAGHRGKVRSLDFSPAGDLLVSCGGRGTAVSLWTLPKGKRSYLKAHGHPVVRVGFSAQPGYLLTADEFSTSYLWQCGKDGTWTSRNLESAYTAFAQDGSQVTRLQLGYNKPRRLDFLQLPGLDPVRDPLPVAFSYASLMAASRKDHVVAISRTSRDLMIIRPNSPPGQWSKETLGNAIIYAIAFSPDGTVVSVATTKSLDRYDVATGEALPSLKGHTRMVTGLAYLDDGRLMSSSTDGTIRTWDHHSGKCVDVRDWQLGPLTGVCLARDGMRAACGSDDGQIMIWDVD